MAKAKHSQGEEIPPKPPAEVAAPAPAKTGEKAFDPDRCTLEALHRHTTINSPFLA